MTHVGVLADVCLLRPGYVAPSERSIAEPLHRAPAYTVHCASVFRTARLPAVLNASELFVSACSRRLLPGSWPPCFGVSTASARAPLWRACWTKTTSRLRSCWRRMMSSRCVACRNACFNSRALPFTRSQPGCCMTVARTITASQLTAVVHASQ